jgi:TPR repeat protein
MKIIKGAFWFAIFVVSSSLSFADENYEKGVYKYDHGDYEAAFELLVPAAENENQNAQFRVAYLLINGLGVSQDIEQGLYWLRRSAEGGYYISQHYLGRQYFLGDITSKDIVEAYAWTAISLRNAKDLVMYHLLENIKNDMTPNQMSQAEELMKDYSIMYSNN